MILKQERGFQKKEFELKSDNILYIKEKGLLSSKEWSIHIESIGYNKFIQTHSRKGITLIGYFFLFFAVLSVLAIFIGSEDDTNWVGLSLGSIFMILMSIICFKAPMSDNLTLSGGQVNLIFFLNSPSKKEVEDFTSKLIQNSKKLVVDKYSRVDADIPEETFISQINWLLQNDLIDKIKYEAKKKEYKLIKLL